MFSLELQKTIKPTEGKTNQLSVSYRTNFLVYVNKL